MYVTELEAKTDEVFRRGSAVKQKNGEGPTRTHSPKTFVLAEEVCVLKSEHEPPLPTSFYKVSYSWASPPFPAYERLRSWQANKRLVHVSEPKQCPERKINNF